MLCSMDRFVHCWEVNTFLWSALWTACRSSRVCCFSISWEITLSRMSVWTLVTRTSLCFLLSITNHHGVGCVFYTFISRMIIMLCTRTHCSFGSFGRYFALCTNSNADLDRSMHLGRCVRDQCDRQLRKHCHCKRHQACNHNSAKM